MRKSRGPAAGGGVSCAGDRPRWRRRGGTRTVGESRSVRLPLRLESERVLVLDRQPLYVLQQPDPIADRHRAAKPAALGHLDQVLLLQAHEMTPGDLVIAELLCVLVELSPPQPLHHLRHAEHDTQQRTDAAQRLGEGVGQVRAHRQASTRPSCAATPACRRCPPAAHTEPTRSCDRPSALMTRSREILLVPSRR